MARRTTSEFRAYPWIEARLKERGWNTKNPNTTATGEVWTQGECLAHPEIQRALGERKPEDVVKVTSNEVWILEAKGHHNALPKALEEARIYAEDINRVSEGISARFITGVAGNDEETYLIQTQFFNGIKWENVRVDTKPFDRFPTKPEILRVLHHGYADLAEVPMSVAEVVELATFINKTLHSAKVEKESRATMVAIALLALENDPDLSMKSTPQVFINDLNSRAETIFVTSRRTSLWRIVKIRPSVENLDTHAKALSLIVERLKASDILHSIRRTDVLGSFFESFLRYGNSSKDLGIVLTPRHICWLAAEAIAVSQNDTVYDPAAGTGGFLIAAFNRVGELVPQADAALFASEQIFAAEVGPKVAALAFVNMHFRGDGKHNLLIDSCFKYRLSVEDGKNTVEFFERGSRPDWEKPAITKVLMNPPFAQEDEPETKFVNHALSQMVDRGLLFSVLPASILYDSQYASWRSELLRTSKVLSVIAFPIDLFYPVATETVGIFVRKGVPHVYSDPILWGRIADDGFVKRKGFRVERQGASYQDVLKPIANALKAWHMTGIQSPEIPGFIEFLPIANSTEELLPQVKIGVARMEKSDLAGEARVIYKNIMGQVWDQNLRKYGHE